MRGAKLGRHPGQCGDQFCCSPGSVGADGRLTMHLTRVEEHAVQRGRPRREVGSRRAAVRRQSAGSCAGTGIRAAAGTGRSLRTSWLCGGLPGRGRARSPLIRCCGSSWPSGWRSGGARSRSARRCAASSRMIRRGMSCTRRSIRRSTVPNWVGCPASCQPGCCARAGGGAGRIAGLASAGRTGSSRWPCLISGPPRRPAAGNLGTGKAI